MFRFYIFSAFEGNMKGTNSEKVIKEYIDYEDFWVIDTKNNTWIISSTYEKQIEEL